MTNKDITKIYFRVNEIVALYRGDTLIFSKKPTVAYTVRGTVKPDSTAQSIQLYVNGKTEQIDINNDKTFEHTFTNVPVTLMHLFAQYCKDELYTLDLSNFNTSQVTDMNSMFANCSALTSLDLSNVDTSKVTNMSRMFSSCYSLTSLDVSSFNTSNVTNMSSMFPSCYSLTSLDVSSFNTSNVTNMGYMFGYCSALTSLDVSSFNTSKVTNMGYMFDNCPNLTSLDVSSFNTSNVTNMSSMFGYDTELTDLYLNFDVSSVQFMAFIFYSDDNLKNVVGKFEGAKADLDLHYSPLTAASAMVFINGLATVTTTRTLSLSATTYDSLTPEQIAIATSKGWTVTRS